MKKIMYNCSMKYSLEIIGRGKNKATAKKDAVEKLLRKLKKKDFDVDEIYELE